MEKAMETRGLSLGIYTRLLKETTRGLTAHTHVRISYPPFPFPSMNLCNLHMKPSISFESSSCLLSLTFRRQRCGGKDEGNEGLKEVKG